MAEIYEKWCFLALVEVLQRIEGVSISPRSMFYNEKSGLEVDVREGSILTGVAVKLGVSLAFTLGYNKKYTRHGRRQDGSWSVEMKPDISLEIVPFGEEELKTVVHFDAKYRVDGVGSGADDAGRTEESAGEGRARRSKRADLVKMHAYRDAIRNSAGSYVLYPGQSDGKNEEFRRYDEMVPGLGAFALTPTTEAHAQDDEADKLQTFLAALLDHVASRQTRRYRADYWQRRSYHGATTTETRRSVEDLFKSPPADVAVLLGFVRDDLMWEWIQQASLYLLRADTGRAGSVSADSAMLRPDLIVLYGQNQILGLAIPEDAISVVNSTDLEPLGYPSASDAGRNYFVLRLGDLVVNELGIDMEAVRRKLTGVWGAPAMTTLDRIMPR